MAHLTPVELAYLEQSAEGLRIHAEARANPDQTDPRIMAALDHAEAACAAAEKARDAHEKALVLWAFRPSPDFLAAVGAAHIDYLNAAAARENACAAIIIAAAQASGKEA